MELCPICLKHGVQVNKNYYITRLRCRYCKTQWHSWRAFEAGYDGAEPNTTHKP